MTNRHHFGSRGEAWVALQVTLFALFLLAPRVGPDWPAPTALRIAGSIAVLGGIAILGASVVALGKSLTPFPRPLPTAELVTSGVYRLVRHPIYFGILLAALGVSLWSMSPLRLALTVVLAVFFDRKASREEEWLLERYPAYPAYRSRVSKLLPYLY